MKKRTRFCGHGRESTWNQQHVRDDVNLSEDTLADFEKHPMTDEIMKGVEKPPDENGLAAWVEGMGHEERITVTPVPHSLL